MPSHDSSPGYWTERDEADAMLRLIACRRLNVEPLLTDEAPARDAPRLYERLMSWDETLLGAIMKWD
jgi:threonine dehydrogenase-like Zn-dependent dehydrogenase